MCRGRQDAVLAQGEVFWSAMAVTETHILLGARLIGGFYPAPINQLFAAAAGLGGRILHGSLTSAIISAVVGNNFHGGAYLEHDCR